MTTKNVNRFISALLIEFKYWCKDNNMPQHWIAQELIASKEIKLTDEQKEYLEFFIELWDKIK